MIKIDEAIENEKMIARVTRGEETREYHEQLAEWLKELKVLKEKITEKEPIDKIMYKECPVCGAVDLGRYCPECGQAIKWE